MLGAAILKVQSAAVWSLEEGEEKRISACRDETDPDGTSLALQDQDRTACQAVTVLL